MIEMLIDVVLVFNCFSFLLFAWDKLMACNRGRRVPEGALLVSVVCLGAIGAMIAMLLFHHKTTVRKFSWMVPIMAVLQIILILKHYHLP